MRFLADMGISWRTTRWLSECGHDAVHLVEQGLEKASDQEIVDKAVAEQRVILTMDLDFPHLLAASRGSTPSVILFRLSDEAPTVVNRHLAFVLEHFSEDLDSGAIVSVRDGHLRVRKLPIAP